MAGRFMNKETLEAEAQRLGVDLTGLTWPQKQKAVMAAQDNETATDEEFDTAVRAALYELTGNEGFAPKEEPDQDENTDLTQFFEDEPEEIGSPVIPGEPVLIRGKYDPMADLRGKTVMICPEMARTPIQLFGYDEVLEDEVTVEEVVHNIDSLKFRAGQDTINGTYNIIGKTGKKVVARTALPKEGAGIYYTFDKDLVPRVIFEGREGYLWTHQRLANIKQLLIDSGYYQKYKDRFVDEPFIWHAAGKLLVCDIGLVHSIFDEIEAIEEEKRVNQKVNREFMRNQMVR